MTSIHLNNDYKSSAGLIRYGTVGQGSDVVLVHGTPTSSFVWDHVIELLQSKYRFHILDLPGYGCSEKFAGQEVRLRSFARALAELIEHIGLVNPILVGHDFGAATVMGAHLVENIGVKAIAIADGVVLSPWGTGFSRHVKEHEAVFAAVPSYIHEATLRAHLQTAMAMRPDEQTMQTLIDPWLGDEGQKAYYRQVSQYDYDYTTQLEALYPTLSVPSLVMWGAHDKWVDISEGHRLHGMIPDAEFATLPDAGHFSMIDTPGLFSEKLDRWMSKVINI